MMRRRFAAGGKFDYRNYMTIEPIQENITLTSHIYPYVEYTTDGREWKVVRPNGVVALKKDCLYSFRKIAEKLQSVGRLYIVGAFNLKGNCMSLVYGDDAAGKTSLAEYDGIFFELFSENAGLQNVDEGFLPATTIAPNCYGNMFAGTAIQNSPILPAENLEYRCYEGMFQNCTELMKITALFTTTPSYDYTYGWVDGVSPTGTFVKNPDATWEVYGDNGIPNGWKVVMDGEESGGGKIENYLRKGNTSITSQELTLDFPAETSLMVYYTTSHSGSSWGIFQKGHSMIYISLGPGESIVSVDRLDPNEDDVYIYKIDYK